MTTITRPSTSDVTDTDQLPEIYDALEEIAATQKNVATIVTDSTKLYNSLKKPRDTFAHTIRHLERVQQACRILRDMNEFFSLTRQLDSIKVDDDGIADMYEHSSFISMAKVIRQIDTEFDHHLNGIEAVDRERKRVDKIHEVIRTTTEQSMNQALEDRNSITLSKALNLYHHLGELPHRIEAFMDAQLKQLLDVILNIIDVDTLCSPEDNISNYKTEQETIVAYWKRINEWIDMVYQSGCKMFDLKAALHRQQGQFRAELISDDDKQQFLNDYWKQLADIIRQSLNASATGAKRGVEILRSGYPRLLWIWHGLFTKLFNYCGETFNAHQPRPQVSLIISSLSTLETVYLRRWQRQLDDQMRKSFAQRGGISCNELAAIGSLLATELETTKFDPRFSNLIIQTADDIVQQCTERGRLLLQSPTTFEIGQGLCTPGQQLNIDIANSMHALLISFEAATAHRKPSKKELACYKSLRQVISMVVNPMIYVFQTTLETVLLKIHSEFNSTINSSNLQSTNNCSIYLDEFNRKLGHLHREYIARFECDEDKRLRLAADATQLEFCASHIASFSSKTTWPLTELGDTYAALRSFRQLLFATCDEITDRKDLQVISPLIRLHQLLIHAYKDIGAPYKLLGIDCDEYACQLNDTTEDERTIFNRIQLKIKEHLDLHEFISTNGTLAIISSAAKIYYTNDA
ncbi:hypothetical protein BDF19DRAFT_424890 [Syncephalis fuscata]|nr:hypothetical protein BDF19DRAFT_424890 [Syncephalis fuscata]